MRMCVDYRKLNDLTRKDRTPSPRSVPGPMNYSTRYVGLTISVRRTCILYKGYHRVQIKERDIRKPTFQTHYGLIEYCVIPFELCNAPVGFQALMNRVLAPPYLGKFCVVYLDDVLIYNQTADEHLEHIRLVLREMQRHKLYILTFCALCTFLLYNLLYFLTMTSDEQAPPSYDMLWKLDKSVWTPTKWRQCGIGPGRNL
jgi:hypothetical protein